MRIFRAILIAGFLLLPISYAAGADYGELENIRNPMNPPGNDADYILDIDDLSSDIKTTGDVYVGGNVGIGTTAASTKLEVKGTGTLGSIVLTDDPSVISSAHEIDIKPNGATDDHLQFLMTGDIPTIKIDTGGPSPTGNDLYITSAGNTRAGITLRENDSNYGYWNWNKAANDFWMGATGPVVILPSGDTAVGVKFTVGLGNPIINAWGALTDPDLYIVAEGGDINFSNENLITTGNVYVGGNVGIGTLAPLTELDVNGDATVDTLYYTALDPAIVTEWTDSTTYINPTDGDKYVSMGAIGTVDIADGDGDAYVPDELEVDGITSLGGNVGIGTTTSDRALRVVGSYAHIGDGGTVNFADGDGDLYVEDELEVDGDIRGADDIIAVDTIQGNTVYQGNAAGDVNIVGSAFLTFSFVGNSRFTISTDVDDNSNTGHILFTEDLDRRAYFDLPSGVIDPHIRIQSSDANSPPDYIQFWHDQTDGNIEVGTGDLNLIANTINLGAIAFDAVVYEDLGVYTNHTAEAKTIGGTPFTIAENAGQDIFYLGSSIKFSTAYFDLDTISDGDITAIDYEYWNSSSAWQNGSSDHDGTSLYTQSGFYGATHSADTKTDPIDTVTGDTTGLSDQTAYYWVRFKWTGDASPPVTANSVTHQQLANPTITTANSTDLILAPAGSVGIGTTTPSEKLDIAGDTVWTGSGLGLPYGCMEGTDETIELDDGSASVYAQVTFDYAGSSNLTTINLTNNDMAVTYDGVYEISITACFHCASGQDFEFLVRKNDGGTDLKLHLFQSTPTGIPNQIENVSGVCYPVLSAGDRLEVWVQCTDSAGIDVIIDHVNLTCHMVGG